MHFLQTDLQAQPLLSSPHLQAFHGTQEVQQGSVKHRVDEPLDETLVMHIKEVLMPFSYSGSSNSKQYLLELIGEYMREEMTLKRFFRELRSMPSPLNQGSGDLYRWLVQLLICTDKDPSCKVMAYLLENGVEETDIEFGSVKRLLSMYSEDQSDKKKGERTRVRKSVSKGLRNPPNKWTKEESQRLIQLVNDYGDKSWKKIAEHVGGGKTGAQCAQHWKRVLCPVIRKGSWDDTEELKLFQLVEKYGQSWKNIASEIGTRTDIQCRYQYFKSCMSREVVWVPQEDDLLVKKIAELKTESRDLHWVEVARYMARGRLTKIPRTGLECRTRYELLTTGKTPDTQVNVPSGAPGARTVGISPLCMTQEELISEMDSGDDLDVESMIVTHSLGAPNDLHL